VNYNPNPRYQTWPVGLHERGTGYCALQIDRAAEGRKFIRKAVVWFAVAVLVTVSAYMSVLAMMGVQA